MGRVSLMRASSRRVFFFSWIAQVLQYRGTSQGSICDTQTLSPLLENPAVWEAIQLWKEVAGPPETTSGTTYTLKCILLWLAGRCAMTLSSGNVSLHVLPERCPRRDHQELP